MVMKRAGNNNPKVALVYDRVNTPHGGAEQVLLALHEIFPDAPLYTSVYHAQQAGWAKPFQVRTSFLQNFPFAKTHHRQYVSLMPFAFESFDFSEFDIVISITSAEAKGIITSPKTLHICYLLTPTRYLWSHHLDYLTGLFSWLKAWQFSNLRQWDFIAGQRPDYIIPISEVVNKRCQKYYQRSTEPVIYPPLPATYANSKTVSVIKTHFLMVSRLVPYKDIDLAIHAMLQSTDKLIIVGDGPEKQNIEKLILSLGLQHRVQLKSNVAKNELQQLYTQAHALLLLAEEDFGIVALEAMNQGTPVIANSKSGASEIIQKHCAGIILKQVTPQSVTSALRQIKTITWDTTVIKRHAKQYNQQIFQKKFLEKITELWKGWKTT